MKGQYNQTLSLDTDEVSTLKQEIEIQLSTTSWLAIRRYEKS